MIELKPLPTYSGIWLRNGSILNFYKPTEINKQNLTVLNFDDFDDSFF